MNLVADLVSEIGRRLVDSASTLAWEEVRDSHSSHGSQFPKGNRSNERPCRCY